MNRRSFLALIIAALPAAFVKLKAQTVVEIPKRLSKVKVNSGCGCTLQGPYRPLTPADFAAMAKTEERLTLNWLHSPKRYYYTPEYEAALDKILKGKPHNFHEDFYCK